MKLANCIQLSILGEIFPFVKACGKFDAVHVKYLKASNPLANLHLPAKVAKWIKWAG